MKSIHLHVHSCFYPLTRCSTTSTHLLLQHSWWFFFCSSTSLCCPRPLISINTGWVLIVSGGRMKGGSCWGRLHWSMNRWSTFFFSFILCMHMCMLFILVLPLLLLCVVYIGRYLGVSHRPLAWRQMFCSTGGVIHSVLFYFINKNRQRKMKQSCKRVDGQIN